MPRTSAPLLEAMPVDTTTASTRPAAAGGSGDDALPEMLRPNTPKAAPASSPARLPDKLRPNTPASGGGGGGGGADAIARTTEVPVSSECCFGSFADEYTSKSDAGGRFDTGTLSPVI